MLRPENTHPANGTRRITLPPANETPAGKILPHPASHAARIFVDTAEAEDIRTLHESGLIHGVTTNPTLLKRAGASSWADAKRRMEEICRIVHPHPVSLELTALDLPGMLRQAEELAALGENAVIKVPAGGFGIMKRDALTGLATIRELWKRDIRVNATLIFNSTQAFWAANAGAYYVSPFLGRLGDYLTKNDDAALPVGNALYHLPSAAGQTARTANTSYVVGGEDRENSGVRLITEIMAIFNHYRIRTEVLAASVRNMAQVAECMLAGADVITIPPTLLREVADHPLSDSGMRTFTEDAEVFRD